MTEMPIKRTNHSRLWIKGNSIGMESALGNLEMNGAWEEEKFDFDQQQSKRWLEKLLDRINIAVQSESASDSGDIAGAWERQHVTV